MSSMRNNIIQDNLEIALESLVLIKKRFVKLKSADDFVSSELQQTIEKIIA